MKSNAKESVRIGFAATALAVAGSAVHLGSVVTRGLASGHVPWGNMYEFTLTGTLVVVVGYLLLYRRYGLSWLSPVVTSFVLVTLMVDVLVLYTDGVTEAENDAGDEFGEDRLLAAASGPGRDAAASPSSAVPCGSRSSRLRDSSAPRSPSSGWERAMTRLTRSAPTKRRTSMNEETDNPTRRTHGPAEPEDA